MHCCFSIDYDQINMIKPASLSFLGNCDVVMWLDHCRNNWPRRHPRRPFLQELNSTIMWLNLIWICCKVGAPGMGIVPFAQGQLIATCTTFALFFVLSVEINVPGTFSTRQIKWRQLLQYRNFWGQPYPLAKNDWLLWYLCTSTCVLPYKSTK